MPDHRVSPSHPAGLSGMTPSSDVVTRLSVARLSHARAPRYLVTSPAPLSSGHAADPPARSTVAPERPGSASQAPGRQRGLVARIVAGPDRRPRRPDARRRAGARPCARVRDRRARAASRSCRAARRPTRPAGSAGSGRGRRSSPRSVATRPGAPSSRRSGPTA